MKGNKLIFICQFIFLILYIIYIMINYEPHELHKNDIKILISDRRLRKKYIRKHSARFRDLQNNCKIISVRKKNMYGGGFPESMNKGIVKGIIEGEGLDIDRWSREVFFTKEDVPGEIENFKLVKQLRNDATDPAPFLYNLKKSNKEDYRNLLWGNYHRVLLDSDYNVVEPSMSLGEFIHSNQYTGNPREAEETLNGFYKDKDGLTEKKRIIYAEVSFLLSVDNLKLYKNRIENFMKSILLTGDKVDLAKYTIVRNLLWSMLFEKNENNFLEKVLAAILDIGDIGRKLSENHYRIGKHWLSQKKTIISVSNSYPTNNITVKTSGEVVIHKVNDRVGSDDYKLKSLKFKVEPTSVFLEYVDTGNNKRLGILKLPLTIIRIYQYNPTTIVLTFKGSPHGYKKMAIPSSDDSSSYANQRHLFKKEIEFKFNVDSLPTVIKILTVINAFNTTLPSTV
jgi:hypothetical protein